MLADNIFILNKVMELTKKGFRLVSISFLVVSVATMVSLVNIEYYYDHPHDHEHSYLVTTVDTLNDMHYKLHSIVGAITSTSNGSNGNNQNNQQNNNDNNMILHTIQGEDAKKILTELEIGNGIQFSVVDDGDGNTVVELVRAPILGEFNNNNNNKENLVSTI